VEAELEVSSEIHALMENADDNNPATDNPEEEHVASGAAFAIARPDTHGRLRAGSAASSSIVCLS
jgi:hypothetical protein